MRDNVDRIRDLGAELVVVGNGNPSQATAFRDAMEIDFPLLIDPSRRTYRAASLKRSVGSSFNLGLLSNARRAFKKGFRQQGVQGDAWQQGGVFVLAAGGDVVYSQRSETAGDHADPKQVLEALAGLAA